jgi:plasmid stability protein
MPALHVRDVPESVMAALRERAAAHGHSVQQEVRQILQRSATARRSRTDVDPIRLVTVRSGTSTWRREDIYDDADR